VCSCDNDALQSELSDLRELMASEAATRATLQDALDESERQLGELRNDLDMTKSVSGTYPVAHMYSQALQGPFLCAVVCSALFSA
jgi:hypothetical protein